MNEQHILQKNLINFIVQDVCNLVTEDDLLEIKSPTVWLHRGIELPKEQIAVYRAQADKLIDSDLWKFLKNEIQYKAYHSLAVKSASEQDMIGSKMMLYLLTTIENKLNHMIQK